MIKHTRGPLILGLLVSILALIIMLSYGIVSAKGLPDPSAGEIQRDAEYGIMPLFFKPNQGLFDERMKFTLQGKDKSIYFTAQGLTFIRTEQIGASPLPAPRTPIEIYSRKTGPLASQKYWGAKLEFVGANHNAPHESFEQAETVHPPPRSRPHADRVGLSWVDNLQVTKLAAGGENISGFYMTKNLKEIGI